MKKVLATVAALGLVLSVSATAFALDTPGRVATGEATDAPVVPVATAPGIALWSVSGSWNIAGAFISNANGTSHVEINDSGPGNDAFYIHSFKILPVLQINDKIAVKGEIRFIDRDIFGAEDSKVDDLNVYHLYTEWMSPLGKTRFGRTPGGAWGSKFGDSSGQRNRLMLWGNWMPENWGMLLFTAKRIEEDVFTVSSDQDRDGYYIDTSYKADFGKTTAAIYYAHNAQGAGVPAAGGGDNYDSTKLWVHGKYAFDNIALEYELDANFGEHNAVQDEGYWGTFVDLSMKSGDFTYGGMFFMVSGDDEPLDGDEDSWFSAVGTIGNDFNPYSIMTGDYMGMLNADKGVLNDAIGSAGVISLGFYGKYQYSPKLTLRGEVGYFVSSDEPSEQDDDMGVEIGVGLNYKLYDNLLYSAHASFLSTGDFFKGNDTGLPNSTYDPDVMDVYVLAHSLSMKF
jgi:hypothetical protein